MKLFFSRLIPHLIARYSWLVIIVASLLAAAAAFYSLKNLHFDTNQDNLISPKQKYFQDYVSFLKEFGDWEYIYVAIEVPPGRDEAARRMASTLATELKKRPDLFDEVSAQIDVNPMLSRALLFLDHEEFERATTLLREKKEIFRDFLAIQTADDWYLWLHRLFTDAGISGWKQSETKKFWPLIKAALFAPHDDSQAARLAPAEIIKKLSGRYLDPQGFLFSDDGRLLFLQVLPHKDYSQMQIVAAPLDFLRERLDEVKNSFPDLSVGITGRPVLQDDEARSTGQDSQLSGMISFLLVTLLYLIFIRRVRFALLGVLALLIAMLWTVGLVTWIYGKVNLLTVTFTVILTGLGIDYGIHFLIRFLLRVKAGQNHLEALSEVSRLTSPAIMLGAITSAVAFSTSVFTDFAGLQQLGVIVGIGIILCALSQLLVFPALLKVFFRDHLKHKSYLRHAWLTVTVKQLIRWPSLVLGILVLLSILCLPSLKQIHINHNLLSLQDQKLESVRYEKIIQKHSEFSTWFLAWQTRDLEELKDIKNKIDQLPGVSRTESLLDYLPPQQDKRVFRITNLATGILKKNPEIRQSEPGKGLALLENEFMKLANQAFSQGMADEFEELSELAADLAELKNHSQQQEAQSEHSPFHRNLAQVQKYFKMMLKPSLMETVDLPELLRQRLQGPSGAYSLTIFPRHDLWQWKNLENFITEVRQVIPDVTGAPVTTYESALRLNQGFILVGILTLVIVTLMIAFYFKSLGQTLLVLATLATSLVWLGATMAWLKIDINLANFFALPVLIGSGVDHAIHILHDARHKNSLHELLDDTVPAVFLSCLTTIFSFGTLIFVHHKGLASFGLVLTLGTTFIMLASVIGLTAWVKIRQFKAEGK